MFLTFLWLIVAVWLYMSGWFLAAKLKDRTDLIDSAWGLGFIVVAWIAWALNGHHQGIKMLTAEFVTLWGVRLALHIYLRNRGKPEDHRYVAYRKKWGKAFWPKAYLNLFMVQGALLLLISTTTIAVMTATEGAWLWLTVLGFAVWIVGMVFEAEADAELVKFVRTKKPGQIMQDGLWRYSRHPNYFGEITNWWGVALIALSVRQWWGVLGALVITFLIVKVSGIPPLEKHYADNPAFQKYKRRTSVLIPWPPKK